MKLIDLLVQELPKHGGWPSGCSVAYCCGRSDVVFEGVNKKPFLYAGLSFAGNDSVSVDDYEAAIAASKQPEWDGDGFPPVGTMCEWQDKNTKAWLPVFVVYSSEWVTVIKEDTEVDPAEFAIENHADEARCKFRPIRTEAERKREEAIEQMMACSAVLVESTAGILYDTIAAGKIPGIKLDGDA